MERYAGKVAIVTGASAGIGAAIAEALVEAGLQVAGLARRKDRVESLAKTLQGKKGKLHAVQADMTKEQDILNAFKWVESNLGPVQILVNNAGVTRKNTIVGGSTADWKTVLDTNVLAVTIACREAIASMQKAKIDGHIVNINSIAGHVILNFPNCNVEPASKHAISALTETLRFDLVRMGSNIRVSARNIEESVSPGFVATEIFEASGFTKDTDLMAQFSEAKALKTKDVADSVIHVLAAPPTVQITELIIKPTGEQF